MATIEEIESRTISDIYRIMRGYDLGRARRLRDIDYKQAKKIIFEGLVIKSDVYNKQIQWIKDYLRL